MQRASSRVVSRQTGPHDKLAEVVLGHRETLDRWRGRRPLAPHSITAFEAVAARLEEGPLVLDSGCGTGESTVRLALRHPDACVVGVDRSADRLHRGRLARAALGDCDGLALVRADVVDVWLLLEQRGVQPREHWLLYPNPSPKPGHLKRRFHGHPAFPLVAGWAARGTKTVLRTNWRVYAEEWRMALELLGVTASLRQLTVAEVGEGLSPFERKYADSGHALWQVTAGV